MREEKRKRLYGNLCLGFGILLNALAIFQRQQNQDLMMPGSEWILGMGLLLLVAIMAGFNLREQVKLSGLLKMVVVAILFCMIIVFGVIVTKQWNVPKISRTTLDYFQGVGGRSLENMAETYDNYQVEFAIIFDDMFDGKEVIIDKEITKRQLLAPILSTIPYSERNTGVRYYNWVDVEKLLKTCQYQTIEGKGADTQQQLYLLTGEAWEKSECIYLIEVNHILLAVPDEIETKISTIEKTSDIAECDVVAIRNTADEGIEQVTMSFHEDETISRVLGTGKYAVLYGGKSFLWMCIIFLSGFVPLILLSNNRTSFIFLALCSFPLGTIIQIAVIFLLGLLGLLKNIGIVLLLEIFAEIVLITFFKKEKIKDILYKRMQKENVIMMVLVLGVLLFFSVIPLTFLSYDSYSNVLIGKQMVIAEDCAQNLGRLIMFSLVSTNLQAEASLLGIPLISTFQPVFTVLGSLLILYLQCRILTRKGLKRKYACIVSILLNMSCMIVPQYFLGSVWLLNNLTIGIWYAISIGCLYIFIHEQQKIFLYVSVIFFFITGVARIEGGVFAVIYLVMIFVTEEISYKCKMKIALGFTAFYGALFAIYVIMIKTIEEGFWTPQNGLMTITLLIGFDMFAILSKKLKGKLSIIVTNLDIVMCITLIAANIFLGLFEGEKFVLTNLNFLANTMSTGYYGILISVYIAILAIKFGGGYEEKDGRLFTIVSTSYILLIILIMQLSLNKTRIGYGDSACRMFLHIVPTISLGIAEGYGKIMTDGRESTNERKHLKAANEINK